MVRHGDTAADVDEIVQPVDNPLSETGIIQARGVAPSLIKYNIDLIVSSPLPRTRDTATIINETLHKELTFNKLLSEVKWPTVLEGLKMDNPKVTEYKNLRNEKSISDPLWHYADEESFLDLKNRAAKLLDEMKEWPGKNILIVTHSTFIKVLVTVMCHGENVTWPVYYDFLLFTRPKHTSISTFNLTLEGKWRLDTWNM
jgi:probable phosphoglycerate mutase